MADFEFKHRDQYDRELEWNRVRVFIEGELLEKCHEDVLPLKVEFAYSDEPIDFNDISTLTFQPLKKGEVWSTQNFGCAWFHRACPWQFVPLCGKQSRVDVSVACFQADREFVRIVAHCGIDALAFACKIMQQSIERQPFAFGDVCSAARFGQYRFVRPLCRAMDVEAFP